MNKVVIGLGSNIEAEKNIQKAREILSHSFKILKESSFVETEPIGDLKQDNFTNGTILLETCVSYDELIKILKQIESDLGRKQGESKFAPRTIDLDIVVWNDVVVDNDFYKRDYLKRAVLELVPHLTN